MVRQFTVRRGRFRRALSFEPLEVRAVPAVSPLSVALPADDGFEPTPTAEASPLHKRLPLHGHEHLAAAGQRPDGGVRLAGDVSAAFASVWDFDAAGNLLREQRLALLPGRTYAGVDAISPNGRWVIGKQYAIGLGGGEPTVYGIWDGDHPDVFVPIDVTPISSFGSARLLDVSDSGIVILIGNGSYRWDAEHGFQRLPSLRDAEGGEIGGTGEARVSAISADGRFIVGESDDEVTRRPTVWTATGYTALPTLGRTGGAASVSSDGRVIGGWTQEGVSFRAAVWVNGELVELKDQKGNPVAGMATTVIEGLGGDESKWVALGTFNQKAWIAFHDGIARPLDLWLYAHYDLDFRERDGILGWSNQLGSGVLDAFLRGNALYVAGHEWTVTAITHGIPGSAFYSPVNPHWIVAPLSEAGEPPAMSRDVDLDGVITPTDALLVINALNDQAKSGKLPSFLGRLDVDGDAELTPTDALLVISFLNDGLPPLPPILVEIVPTGPAMSTDTELSPAETSDLSLLALVADQICRELDAQRCQQVSP